jgi:hypothetical protein
MVFRRGEELLDEAQHRRLRRGNQMAASDEDGSRVGDRRHRSGHLPKREWRIRARNQQRGLVDSGQRGRVNRQRPTRELGEDRRAVSLNIPLATSGNCSQVVSPSTRRKNATVR